MVILHMKYSEMTDRQNSAIVKETAVELLTPHADVKLAC